MAFEPEDGVRFGAVVARVNSARSTVILDVDWHSAEHLEGRTWLSAKWFDLVCWWHRGRRCACGRCFGCFVQEFF